MGYLPRKQMGRECSGIAFETPMHRSHRFRMGEIDFRIASLEGPSEADDDPADALPEIAAGPPVSRVGDAWILDRHRILCGSTLDRQTFATLLDDERAAMVFTPERQSVITWRSIMDRAQVAHSNPFEFIDDSPLEGSGFELSVPRDTT